MNTPESEIKAWLKAKGRDRDWLAKELNTTKAVIDSWFSTRGFPKDRLVSIQKLMGDPEDSTSLIRIPFTDEQLRNTQDAAAMTKMDLQSYCQKAIEENVKQDLKQADYISQFNKAAEDPTEYKPDQKP